jgi:hypothetical protein
MSMEQCWALMGNGSRCVEPAIPESRFCQYHARNGGPSPLWIWRPLAPEAPAAAPEPPAVPAAPDLPASAETPGDPIGWFPPLLQQLIMQVMADEGTPIQKANVIARLGGLYLKAARAAELARTTRELTQRVAELEKQLAAATAPGIETGSGEEARPAEEQLHLLAGVDDMPVPSSSSPEPAAHSSSDPDRILTATSPLSDPGSGVPDATRHDSRENGRSVSNASPARCASP